MFFPCTDVTVCLHCKEESSSVHGRFIHRGWGRRVSPAVERSLIEISARHCLALAVHQLTAGTETRNSLYTQLQSVGVSDGVDPAGGTDSTAGVTDTEFKINCHNNVTRAGSAFRSQPVRSGGPGGFGLAKSVMCGFELQ